MWSEVRRWTVAIAAVFCLSSIGYRVLTAPALPDLAPTIAKLDATLATINHPCAPGPCGTLANIDKLVVKVGDIAVDTQTQVRQSGALINSASQSLTSTSQHLNAAVDAATGTLQTAQQTVAALQAPITQATATLGAAQRTTEALQPVIAHADSLVTDPAIKGTIANVESTTGHLDATTKDVQTAVHKYLFPTWPERVLGWLKSGAIAAGQVIF